MSAELEDMGRGFKAVFDRLKALEDRLTTVENTQDEHTSTIFPRLDKHDYELNEGFGVSVLILQDKVEKLENRMAELKVFHDWLKSVENLEVAVTQVDSSGELGT